MPTRDELKAKVCQEIDKRVEDIIGVAKEILQNPEPGFREQKTSKIVTRKFGELGLSYKDGIALTGVKTVVIGGSSGPTVAVLGELDSLIIPDHPFADKITGAAHACGHNCQVAMMYAVTAAITKSSVLPSLAGRCAFMAVPAEEYIEIEYRDELRQQGKLHYLGGKPEFIRVGAFDDVDMAMMTHTSSEADVRKLALRGTNNGCIAKRIQFIGKSAHAGGMPHKGINALNAAMLALSAIHAQRETFRDEDTIRIHPIITKGGDAVNAVPADVRMETFVRGKTIEAILDANIKVDRSLRAGAMAVGGKVKITTLPGYMPLNENLDMQSLYKANAVSIVGENNFGYVAHSTGSTDMGDVEQIIPGIHPYAGGVTGTSHGNDYITRDYTLAVINPAKAMAMTIVDLLADGAVKAKEVIANYKPKFTRQGYLEFMDKLLKEELSQG
jgi:amidohydrolase